MHAPTEAAATAAHRLMQAQRTLEPEALTSNWLYTHQKQAAAATQREAARLAAIGAAGRYDEDQAGPSHL